MKVKVTTTGFRELESALGEFKKSTAMNVLRRAALKALEPMAEHARRLAPDDPKTPAPDLKSSIKTEAKNKRRGGVVANMGPTKDGYPQALPQEFGAKQHPPQAFMRPAWDAGHAKLLDDVRSEISSEIGKAADRARRKAQRAAARG